MVEGYKFLWLSFYESGVKVVEEKAMTPINESPKPTLPVLVVEIKFYLQRTAENIVEIGKRLIQAKELVPHGEWQNWLENNFNFSQSTAQRFIKCAERFGKSAAPRDLNPSQMFELLSLPVGDEEKFIAEKSAEGTPVEDMTVKKLREEIKEWKSRAEKAESDFKASEIASDIKDGQLENLSEEYEKLKNTYKAECERMGGFMTEHADLLEEREKLSDEVAELQNKLANRATVEVPPADYAQLKTENAELKSETENLQKEIKTLQERPIEVTTEYPSDYEPMKKQLAELKAKEVKLQNTLENVSKLETLFSLADTLLNTTELVDAVHFICGKDFKAFNTKLTQLENLFTELKNCTPSN